MYVNLKIHMPLKLFEVTAESLLVLRQMKSCAGLTTYNPCADIGPSNRIYSPELAHCIY